MQFSIIKITKTFAIVTTLERWRMFTIFAVNGKSERNLIRWLTNCSYLHADVLRSNPYTFSLNKQCTVKPSSIHLSVKRILQKTNLRHLVRIEQTPTALSKTSSWVSSLSQQQILSRPSNLAIWIPDQWQRILQNVPLNGSEHLFAVFL